MCVYCSYNVAGVDDVGVVGCGVYNGVCVDVAIIVVVFVGVVYTVVDVDGVVCVHVAVYVVVCDACCCLCNAGVAIVGCVYVDAVVVTVVVVVGVVDAFALYCRYC